MSAGAGNTKAFGIDRAANPWDDMIGSEVIWVAGSNVADCAPITTNYIWQARERGAKVIVQDPRITPIGRTCDLYLPVRPGRDAALFAGVLGLMIEEGWIDREFIDAHTVGFEGVADYCKSWPLARAAEVSGVPERSLRKAAELWGAAKSSFFLHARGIEHHSNGVQNVLGAINLVLATGRIGKPHCGYATITGQANGQGGREHGQKCTQLPGGRDISNPEDRAYVASVWKVEERDLPGPGVDAYEMFRKIDAGEIKGLVSICFNPKVSLPDNQFVTRALEKLEFYVAIDFFLNEPAARPKIGIVSSTEMVFAAVSIAVMVTLSPMPCSTKPRTPTLRPPNRLSKIAVTWCDLRQRASSDRALIPRHEMFFDGDLYPDVIVELRELEIQGALGRLRTMASPVITARGRAI